MYGVSPSDRRRRDRTRRRRSEPDLALRDQEDEVRERLYAKPPVNERTVELLGPVSRLEERPAA